MRIHNWSELQKCAKFEIIVFDQYFFCKNKEMLFKIYLRGQTNKKVFYWNDGYVQTIQI